MLNSQELCPTELPYLCGMEKKKGRPAKNGKTEKVSVRLPHPFCNMTSAELVSLLIAAHGVGSVDHIPEVPPAVKPKADAGELPEDLAKLVEIITRYYGEVKSPAHFISVMMTAAKRAR